MRVRTQWTFMVARPRHATGLLDEEDGDRFPGRRALFMHLTRETITEFFSKGRFVLWGSQCAFTAHIEPCTARHALNTVPYIKPPRGIDFRDAVLSLASTAFPRFGLQSSISCSPVVLTEGASRIRHNSQRRFTTTAVAGHVLEWRWRSEVTASRQLEARRTGFPRRRYHPQAGRLMDTQADSRSSV